MYIATYVHTYVYKIIGSCVYISYMYVGTLCNFTFPAGKTIAECDAKFKNCEIGNITIASQSLPMDVYIGDPHNATIIGKLLCT